MKQKHPGEFKQTNRNYNQTKQNPASQQAETSSLFPTQSLSLSLPGIIFMDLTACPGKGGGDQKANIQIINIHKQSWKHWTQSN